MTPLEYCLSLCSDASDDIWMAELYDDVDMLAGIIAAAQLIETKAQRTNAGRVSQNIVNDIKDAAYAELGPGWEPNAQAKNQ